MFRKQGPGDKLPGAIIGTGTRVGATLIVCDFIGILKERFSDVEEDFAEILKTNTKISPATRVREMCIIGKHFSKYNKVNFVHVNPPGPKKNMGKISLTQIVKSVNNSSSKPTILEPME